MRGAAGKGGLLEASGGKRNTLRKRAYEYLHGVIISSPGGKPDFRRGEFSACYFASPRYISAIVLSLGNSGTTRCALDRAPFCFLARSPCKRSEIAFCDFRCFNAAPPDFLRALDINGPADFNPRSQDFAAAFRRSTLRAVRSPVRIPARLSERVQLFVRYFR